MYVKHIFGSLLLLVFISTALGQQNQPLFDGNVTTINLTTYNTHNLFKQRYTFEPSSNVTFNITNISPVISFIILQVHTYEYNVTLSYDEENLDKISNNSVIGSNIGLLAEVNAGEPIEMFAKNANNKKVEALLVITLYEHTAPIPGGCNMEFNVKYAPYQKLTFKNEMITVDFQPASEPATPKNSTSQNCEKNKIHYDVYRLYLTEQDFSVDSYFQAISSMLSVQDVRHHGEKISEPNSYSFMRRIFSAYRGTGSVHAVIATYDNYPAAYVPTFTYSCHPLLNPDSCKYLVGALENTVCALNLIVGLLFIYFGHRFFRLELCYHLYLLGTFIGYICAAAAADYETSTNIGIGMATGFMMIMFTWLWICCCCNSKHPFRYVIATITFGPFIGCVSYRSSAAWLQNSWYFYLLFVTIMILTFVLTMAIPYVVSTATASVLTSYFVIMSIDYYTGTNLKYIMVNMIRRLTIPGFNVAIITPPSGATEIILILFWVFLAAFRTGRHYLRMMQKKQLYSQV